MMVDPDAPSRTNPQLREIRHWLIMNILESNVESGDEVTEYRGSGAPKSTGLHRYIFLVFKQPEGMIIHDEPYTSNKYLLLQYSFQQLFNTSLTILESLFH